MSDPESCEEAFFLAQGMKLEEIRTHQARRAETWAQTDEEAEKAVSSDECKIDLETIDQSVEKLDVLEGELMEMNDYADFIIRLLREKSDEGFKIGRCREELGNMGVVKRLQTVTEMLRHEFNYLPSKLKTIEGLIK